MPSRLRCHDEFGHIHFVTISCFRCLPLFQKNDDYLAFERVLAESLERPDAPRLLAWCLMPNHWRVPRPAATARA